MTVDNPAHQAARAARALLRGALKGTLATLDHRNAGQPYASLILVATEPDGTPMTLISGLALHTRNLAGDARASLLLDATAGLDDPMTGARLTLSGRAMPTQSVTACDRFLARHPAARAYVDLPDFRFFAFHIETAHFIEGFGRIVDLDARVLAADISGADDLIAGERDLVARINAMHAPAIASCASAIAPGAAGEWSLVGIDPDGMDLLQRSNGLRIAFAQRVLTCADAEKAAVEAIARGKGAGPQGKA